jgi:adenosine kinase
VRFMVLTRGEKGAQVYAGDREYEIPILPPDRIADPTGVGDAFRGGFLIAYSLGLDWGICGRVGALAATYCLENSGPQGHFYTPAEFVARYRRHFDDSGALDVLIPS